MITRTLTRTSPPTQSTPTSPRKTPKTGGHNPFRVCDLRPLRFENRSLCPNVEKTVTAFTALKSLISRGSSEGHAIEGSSLPGPRSDVRGPVVTPIGTAVTPVTPEMIEGMVSAYESGASLISIAREQRLGKEKVRDLLKDAGVRIRRQGLDDQQTDVAIRAYESGQTTREVARDLGVGHSMVWRALRRAGITLRPNVRRTR